MAVFPRSGSRDRAGGVADVSCSPPEHGGGRWSLRWRWSRTRVWPRTEGEVAQTAGPEDGNASAGTDTGLADSVIGGHARAAERSGVEEVESVGGAGERVGEHGDGLGRPTRRSSAASCRPSNGSPPSAIPSPNASTPAPAALLRVGSALSPSSPSSPTTCFSRSSTTSTSMTSGSARSVPTTSASYSPAPSVRTASAGSTATCPQPLRLTIRSSVWRPAGSRLQTPRAKVPSPRQRVTITTSSRLGPCTPSTRSSSMSLVAEGPEIQV